MEMDAGMPVFFYIKGVNMQLFSMKRYIIGVVSLYSFLLTQA